MGEGRTTPIRGPAPLRRRLPERVEGPRVVLSLWAPDEIDEVAALVDRSRDHLRTFLAWAVTPASAEEEAAIQRDARARWEARMMAGWTLREGGAIRGMLGLHRRGGPDELEIGYWLAADATGRGLMTEACTMATDVAFDNEEIDVVEIVHDRANLRSGAVPARLGFVRTAAFSSPPRTSGESGIKVRWCATRKRWLAREAPRAAIAVG